MRALALVLVLGCAGCASAPAGLTPQAVTAFADLRATRALDLLRDTAVLANQQTPPQLSESTTRKVVQAHESTLKIIHASGSGWQAAVNATLVELLANLPAADRPLVAPYVALVQTILAEVH